jgi:hypothetical protein
VGDVNGDGKPDLVVTKGGYAINVFLGNGNGTFQGPQTFSVGSGRYPGPSLAIADLNGDGKPDLVIFNLPGAVTILLGNGNGTFEAAQTFSVDVRSAVAATGDLNEDGRTDVVVGGGNSDVTVLFGDSRADFAGQAYTVNGPLDEVFGSRGDDTIHLNRQSGSEIAWSINGGLFTDIPINDPNGLTINGNGGNDGITLDYTNGNPLPNILHLNGTFTINGLQGTNPLAGTTMDIGRSTVFISYASPASDPIAAIKAYLQAGYNAGGWNGTPTATTGVITSLAAQSNPNHNTAIGYADSADGQGVNQSPVTVELTYTLFGDANLDHQVNSADLQRLLAAFNTNGAWDQGDFNYDGIVNSADLQALLSTFNTQLGNQPALALAASSPSSAQQNQKTAGSPPAALMPVVSSKPGHLAGPAPMPSGRAGKKSHR